MKALGLGFESSTLIRRAGNVLSDMMNYNKIQGKRMHDCVSGPYLPCRVVWGF